MRRGFELPLVLEERGFVDVIEKVAQAIVFYDANAPERRRGDIRRIGYDGAALGEDRAGFVVDSRGFGIFLHGASFRDACVAGAVGSSEIFHDVQAGESVIGIEDAVRVFTAEIVFHVFAGESCPAADHRELQLLALKILNHVLHLERGLHQEAAQADRVRLMLLCRANNRVAWLFDPEVDDLESVVRQDDVDQVLANVVHVALHGREYDRALLRAGFLLHLGLEISDGLLHDSGGVEHRRQLHFSGAK